MKLKQAAKGKGDHKLEPPKAVYEAQLNFKAKDLKLKHRTEYLLTEYQS